jgi:hypothetical protein
MLLRNALKTGLKSKYVRETMMRGLDRHRPANILIHEHREDANLAAPMRRERGFHLGQKRGDSGTAKAGNPIGEVI